MDKKNQSLVQIYAPGNYIVLLCVCLDEVITNYELWAREIRCKLYFHKKHQLPALK